MATTPEPWDLVRYQETPDTHHFSICAIPPDDGRRVDLCEIFPISDDSQPGGESHANARLLFAAKDFWRAMQLPPDMAHLGITPEMLMKAALRIRELGFARDTHLAAALENIGTALHSATVIATAGSTAL